MLTPTALLVAFLAGLAVLWAVASPVGGAPDEEQHVVYAWGMASGDAWTPEVVQKNLGSEENPVLVPSVPVEVPDTLMAIIDHRCYSFNSAQPAYDCAADLAAAGSTGSTTELTYMARYPPSYYLPAGLVLRAGLAAGLDGPAALVLLRVLSGLWGVALLAAAMAVLRRHVDQLRVVVTTVLAVPPLAMFIGSAVNPNGAEVAYAVLVAAAVVSIRTDVVLERAPSRSAVAALAVAAPLLALVRPLSVAWLGILLAVLVLPVRRPAAKRTGWTVPLLRLPRLLVMWAVLSVAAGLGWLYWSATGRGIQSTDQVAESWAAVSTADRVALVVLRYTSNVLEYVGNFGWLDTPLPTGASTSWVAAVVVVLTLVVVRDTWPSPRAWHLGLAVVVTGHAVVVAHTVLTGFSWQPRYVLPCLSAAFVVVAGSPVRLPRRSATLLSAAAVVGVLVHTFSPVWTYARFRWGFEQPSARFPSAPLPQPRTDRDVWQPLLEPLPLGLLVIVVLACGLVAVLLAGAGARRSPEPPGDRVPSPPADMSSEPVTDPDAGVGPSAGATAVSGPGAEPPAGTGRSRS